MITDWMLVRRMAHEIEGRLRGGKVRDAGLLADGRPAIAIWARGSTHLLCLDLFGTPPIVTIEDGELPIRAEPGFIRTLATTLRATALLAVKSRREDRLLRCTFGARSRFGVSDEIELYVELVPRFGNAILVKGGVIVDAMKEFTLAENPARAILAGQPYELPPLLRRNHAAAPVVADDTMTGGPVYVVRDGGHITALSLLPQPGAEPHDALLPLLAQFRTQRHASADHASAERKRSTLLRRLDAVAKKLARERANIDERRTLAERRDELQREGEAIFATLHEVPDSERPATVERAQKLFAKYKKLGASLPHIEQRREQLDLAFRAIEELRWESERAGDADLHDVELAIDHLDRPRGTEAPKATKRKRRPLEVRTESGARILIGRSPIENADLTFRVARPDDLWLHAQNIPGAHVILQRDDREEFDEHDIETAAQYAAGHSKARASGTVAVDYTRRKHVRKQKDAAPGLVWYTNFKTVLSVPKTAE